MSIEAQVAVLSLIEELTPDEYRLLSIIAQTGGHNGDAVRVNWGRVLSLANMSDRQCGRILRGLHSDELIKFVSSDRSMWLSLFDPRLPVPVRDGLDICIAGMAETESIKPPRLAPA